MLNSKRRTLISQKQIDWGNHLSTFFVSAIFFLIWRCHSILFFLDSVPLIDAYSCDQVCACIKEKVGSRKCLLVVLIIIQILRTLYEKDTKPRREYFVNVTFLQIRLASQTVKE